VLVQEIGNQIQATSLVFLGARSQVNDRILKVSPDPGERAFWSLTSRRCAHPVWPNASRDRPNGLRELNREIGARILLSAFHYGARAPT
jgi:hypothetical protein